MLLVHEFFVSLPFFDHFCSFPGLFILFPSLSFCTATVCIGLFPQYCCAIKKFGSCYQFGELLGSSLWWFILYVLEVCRGKSVTFGEKLKTVWGDAGLIPSLVQIVFVPYFPAVCVMLG